MTKQVVSHRKRNGSGTIPSLKLNKMVYYRNLIKRDYIRLLEHDPAVLTYQEQPCSIRYVWDTIEFTYIPDFSVAWHQLQPGIIACTWEAKVKDPKYLPTWTAAQLWCEGHGYEFHLVTESSLQQYQVLLSNIKMLAVHSHQALPPQAYEYLMKAVVAETNSLSIDEIVQRTPLLDARTTRSYIWHLLATGDLSTDLTKPLHVETTHISWKGAQHTHDITSRL